MTEDMEQCAAYLETVGPWTDGRYTLWPWKNADRAAAAWLSVYPMRRRLPFDSYRGTRDV